MCDLFSTAVGAVLLWAWVVGAVLTAIIVAYSEGKSDRKGIDFGGRGLVGVPVLAALWPLLVAGHAFNIIRNNLRG